MSTQRKPYDYAEACIRVALRDPLHSDDFRRILRRLVRQAVREAMSRYAQDEWINSEADRIAKGLVP